jgi:RHS repeat-associated protein
MKYITTNTNYYSFGMAQSGRNLNSADYKFGYNGKEKDDEIKGSGNSVDFGARMLDTRVGRWMKTDNLEDKYPGISTYAYVANSPLRCIDPDGNDIYVLFHVVGHTKSFEDRMFRSSAETRKRNIESSPNFSKNKDLVYIVPIMNLDDIEVTMEQDVAQLAKVYGQTVEVGVWSHAGSDGPFGTTISDRNPLYERGRLTTQITLKGWSEINFNWSDQQASIVFYGCNTANPNCDLNNDGNKDQIFAKEISLLPNFAEVDVVGQTSSAYPSFSSDNRNSSPGRTMAGEIAKRLRLDFGEIFSLFSSTANTYMVGGNKSQGWEASFGVIPANPMHTYVNGTFMSSGLQGTSTDHVIPK